MARTTNRTPLEQFMARSRDLARARDVKKGFERDDAVTIAYLVGIYHGQNGKCFHTGETMTLERGLVEGAVVPELCTIDRIDNRKGYEVGNIIMACDGINRMRSDMDLKKFQTLCKKIGLKA
jgi:hypothetical protein